MRGSTLEKRMAINAIQSSTTFQAAESASDLALNNPSHLTSAYRNGKDRKVSQDCCTLHKGLQPSRQCALNRRLNKARTGSFPNSLVQDVFAITPDTANSQSSRHAK